MFPPLCFVDESKAEVEYDKTEEKINSKQNASSLEVGMNFDENESDKSRDIDKESKGNDVKIKFKIVEVVKNLFD